MLKRYFFAGLLVWVPIWLTLAVIRFIADLFNKVLTFLPAAYQPQHLLGVQIPGIGLIFTLLLVLLTGLIATNFLGKKIVRGGEAILQKIPIVRSLYSGTKQVLQTFLANEGESFKKVLLIRFPHSGVWTVAFQTGVGFAEAQAKLAEELVTVFVPTAPNPTAGFVMMLPKNQTIELNMTVDAALKFIVSLGVITPSVMTSGTMKG